MDTRLLLGKPVSAALRSELKSKVDVLGHEGIVPNLAAVLVGDDPASQVYVRNKSRAFEKLNCKSKTHRLCANIAEAELLSLIRDLNADHDVHGILVQLPLPKQLDSRKILHAVSPDKDVDGFHPVNLGHLLEGNPQFIPCTPNGVLKILKYY